MGGAFFIKGEKMRIAVLVGFNESGESEALATGNFSEMNKMAKQMTLENETKWERVRIFEQYNKQYKCAEPKKPSRGRPKKVEE